MTPTNDIKAYKDIHVFGPLAVTLAVVIWTSAVSPITTYGDNWALYPVIAAGIVLLAWYCFVLVRRTSSAFGPLVGALNLLLFLVIFAWSLMSISKDSL